MIETNYDITKTNCDYIFHGCNAQGVMGSGVAKAIRTAWPEIFPPYQQYCKSGNICGTALITPTRDQRYVGNLITQQNYGRSGKYASEQWISYAIDHAMAQIIPEVPLFIAIPRIGCGLGGLDWHNVRPLLLEKERQHDIKFVVCYRG